MNKNIYEFDANQIELDEIENLEDQFFGSILEAAGSVWQRLKEAMGGASTTTEPTIIVFRPKAIEYPGRCCPIY